jgi:hypothetical protein
MRMEWHVCLARALSDNYNNGTVFKGNGILYEGLVIISKRKSVHWIINNYCEGWAQYEEFEARSLCYQPKPKAEVDNTNWGLHNSSYCAKTEY